MSETQRPQDVWVERFLGMTLEEAHPEVASGDIAPEMVSGLVAYRKALLAFGQAKAQVTAQLAKLRQAIPAAVPEESELADQVADQIEGLTEALGDAVDAAINTANDARAPYNEATKRLIDDYLKVLAEDELISHVDRNPFAPTTIAASLSAALTGIRQRMV
jgi:hypothetical protein